MTWSLQTRPRYRTYQKNEKKTGKCQAVVSLAYRNTPFSIFPLHLPLHELRELLANSSRRVSPPPSIAQSAEKNETSSNDKSVALETRRAFMWHAGMRMEKKQEFSGFSRFSPATAVRIETTEHIGPLRPSPIKTFTCPTCVSEISASCGSCDAYACSSCAPAS